MGNRTHLCCVKVIPVCVVRWVCVLLDEVWCAMILFVGVYGIFVAVRMMRFSERVGWML